MKNTLRKSMYSIGIIALAAVWGFSMAALTGCDTGGSGTKKNNQQPTP